MRLRKYGRDPIAELATCGAFIVGFFCLVFLIFDLTAG